MTATMFDSPEPSIGRLDRDEGMFGGAPTFQRLQQRRSSRVPYMVGGAALAAGVVAFAATSLMGGREPPAPAAGSEALRAASTETAPLAAAPLTPEPALAPTAAAPAAPPAQAAPAAIQRVSRPASRARPAPIEASRPAPAGSAALAPAAPVAASPSPLIVVPPPAEPAATAPQMEPTAPAVP